MAEEQPTFKVVDRRLFNPDGSPRELSEEEKAEADRAATAAAVENAAAAAMPPKKAQKQSASPPSAAPREPSQPAARERAPRSTGGDPLDDPTSFLSLIMSLASNAAASLGMMPHPATGETGVDLQTAKHWIDVLGMLEEKTRGNLDEQEARMLENLLADLRMQYVSFAQSSTPPPAKFSASDITGGK
jgi:uncharacterized protein DUF1844